MRGPLQKKGHRWCPRIIEWPVRAGEATTLTRPSATLSRSVWGEVMKSRPCPHEIAIASRAISVARVILADLFTPKALNIKAQGRAAHPGNACTFDSWFAFDPSNPGGVPHGTAATPNPIASGATAGDTLWNPVGVRWACRARYPGCAARPWALMFNAFGVSKRQEHGRAHPGTQGALRPWALMLNAFGVRRTTRAGPRPPRYPGCAARPWALMLNAFGVRKRQEQGSRVGGEGEWSYICPCTTTSTPIQESSDTTRTPDRGDSHAGQGQILSNAYKFSLINALLIGTTPTFASRKKMSGFFSLFRVKILRIHDYV